MEESIYANLTAYLCGNMSHIFFEVPSRPETLADVLTGKVIIVICVLGLVGNILNLIILIPLGFRSALGRIEKCAYSGLIALASSDLCFCVIVIPKSFESQQRLYNSVTFELVYKMFENAFINMFVLTSTWLTVTMAIGRYLAICHPLWARETIGPTMAKRSIILVCIACVILNVPRFWVHTVFTAKCEDGRNIYATDKGFLQANYLAAAIYNWFYFAIGIALPFITLLSSNVWLIRALRSSRATQRQYRERGTERSGFDPNHVITLTMIIIIVMYIALVSPAEFIHFLGNKEESDETYTQYNLVVAIVNTMQAVNFAFNFILYFAINVSFRRSLFRMMCCQPHPAAHRAISHRSSASTEVFLRTSSRGGPASNITNGNMHSCIHMPEMAV